jgi:hypothetical protein
MPGADVCDWPGHLKTDRCPGPALRRCAWLLDCAHAAGWNWW